MRLVEWIRTSDQNERSEHGDARGKSEAPDLLDKILAEMVRLYPAGWAFERCACEATSLGGEPIAKGTRLLFSPFLLHRNPRVWKNPEDFDPDRFQESITAPAGIPKYGFLPFGAGPRSCIGARMVWTEMRLILKALVGQCQLTLDLPTGEPALQPGGSFKIRLNQPLRARADFYSESPGSQL